MLTTPSRGSNSTPLTAALVLELNLQHERNTMHKFFLKRCLIWLPILLFIYSFSLFAQETLPSDYSGYYLLNNQEAKKTFGEIADIMFWTNHDSAVRTNQKINDKFIRYKLTKISTKANTISFSTETLNGIHYEFKGRFLATGNFQDEWPTGEVLKGHLIKKQGDKVLTESNVSFTYFGGD
jgi:hypothetical protein